MHVFLSYAKADTYDLAMQLDAEISALLGVTCWVDREITPGHSWALQIQNQIQKCDVMAVLISPDVNRDPLGDKGLSFVLNELALALDLRKTIIPVLVGSTHIPLQIYTLQYIDCVANLKTGQAKLLAHIRQLAGGGTEDLSQSTKPKEGIEFIEKTVLAFDELPDDIKNILKKKNDIKGFY